LFTLEPALSLSSQPAAENAPSVLSRLKFTGSGREYFGIWIVNILLTIVTLGIYSAWAKVRRNRYFFGNTQLLDRGFDYHAQPKQILIGRIIAFALLLVYNLALNFFPVVGLVLAVLLLIAAPALIVRGLRFNARMTSYRNVRFGFDGKYWGAVKAFIAGPLLATFSFGLLTPVASKWSSRYVFNNLRYGGKKFSAAPSLGAIYKAWLIPAGVTIIGLLLLALIVFANYASITGSLSGADFSDPERPPLALLVVVYSIVIGLFLVYAFAGLFYSAAVRNIVLNASLLDNRHRLHSDMPRLKYVWVAVSNFFVTIFTLGLMRPWAAVRMARFQAQHTGVTFDGEIGDVFSEIRSDESAVGGEFMDLEGIAVGF
jgi:uncharacterized membrane protein YjgN (DUF898 family)